MIEDSGKEYTFEWWRELCTRLGIHHLRCEIYSQRALLGERAGRSLSHMLHKELASEKKIHWLEIMFALLRRYLNTPLYHGLSPNEIVFGRKKCRWNMPLNNPRLCTDASLFMDEIQRAEKLSSFLIDKHQAYCLWVQNLGQKQPHNFGVDDQFGFENQKPLWTEMISFFPCDRAICCYSPSRREQVKDPCGCQPGHRSFR